VPHQHDAVDDVSVFEVVQPFPGFAQNPFQLCRVRSGYEFTNLQPEVLLASFQLVSDGWRTRFEGSLCGCS
jgi:hypothetical protein